MAEDTVPSLDEFVATARIKACTCYACRHAFDEDTMAAIMDGLAKGYERPLIAEWVRRLGFDDFAHHHLRTIKAKHGGES